jgi:hypothetical protein
MSCVRTLLGGSKVTTSSPHAGPFSCSPEGGHELKLQGKPRMVFPQKLLSHVALSLFLPPASHRTGDELVSPVSKGG